MHVLIIPSEPFMTEWLPLGGVFQWHQALAIRSFADKVGILGIGFLNVNKWKYYRKYKNCETSENILIVRFFRKRLVPLRFLSEASLRSEINKVSISAYLQYEKLNGKPDIIHAHNSVFALAHADAIRERTGIPFVLTEHSSEFVRGLLTDRQIKLTEDCLKNARYRFAVSSFLAKKMNSIFPDTPSFSVLANVLDEEFVRTPCARDCARKKYVFLSVANLDPNKNQKLLIDAFARLYVSNQNIELRLAGHGPDGIFLEEYVKSLGLEESVKFLGRLPRSRVKAEMQSADCFVISSKVETFGVVAIEANFCGIPVISTRCGGPEDVINSDNGLLVEGDVDSLYFAMQRVKEDLCFNEQKIRLSAIERYGKESFALKLQSIYLQVLGENT